ncbi:hypothetical protein LLH00_06965 [bacterium]|nr:hypothetical protein [bacterium]
MPHNGARNLRLLLLCLSALLTLADCGHDIPLAPGKGAILQDYLPQEDGQQQYQFTLVSSYQAHNYETYKYHIMSGVCSIQMIHGQSSSSAEELIADIAFAVELDSLDKQYTPYPNDRILTVKNAYSLSQTIHLYLSADSLWYVPADSAQSGYDARHPMLSYSADKGGTLIDLAPFLLPGWFIAPDATQYNSAEVRGDTLIYILSSSWVPCYNGVVRFLKGSGLLSVDSYYYEGGTISGGSTNISYRRI